jgi:hypothetical protein
MHPPLMTPLAPALHSHESCPFQPSLKVTYFWRHVIPSIHDRVLLGSTSCNCNFNGSCPCTRVVVFRLSDRFPTFPVPAQILLNLHSGRCALALPAFCGPDLEMEEAVIQRSWLLSLLLALTALLVSPLISVAQNASPVPSPVATPAPLPANTTLVAEGFNNPRGFEFGPDGAIYLAEGGLGGTNSTVGQCDQVPAPLGPYTGDNTARISKIAATEQQPAVTTLIDNLPSTQTSAETGGDISGVAEVAFVDGELYYLLGGAGCSHGHPDVPNGVFKVNDDGTTMLVADLSAYIQVNPVAQPNAGDFEPDETWYSLVEHDGMLYVVGPNGGSIEMIDPATSEITRVVDISATEGHIVPTSLAFGPDGTLYFVNLNVFPIVAGQSAIYSMTPDGTISEFATGFTAELGIAFDAQGNLYVLDTSGAATGPAPFTPGSGRVIRVGPSGEQEVIVEGLTQPTALTLGPDGNLYATNFGWQSPAGSGQILRIDIAATPGTPIPQATPVA